jgi:hypothetical protein
MSVGSKLNTVAAGLWRAATSSNTRRAVTISLLLGALLVFAGLQVREAANMQSGIANGLAMSDPARQFRENPMGQVLFSPYVGERCRRLLFDNRTGAFESADDVNCVQGGRDSETSTSSAQDRMNAMKKTFRSQ